MRACLFIALIPSVALGGVSRKDCFPIEQLPAALRPKAESLLLKMMDGEALYTLVGGIKPMSSGWLEVTTKLESPDHKQLEELRQILAVIKCGNNIGAFLQPFRTTYNGKRSLSGILYSRPTFTKKLTEKQAFFGYLGLTPSSSPIETVLATEMDDTPRRNRGYGYLFGYPDYAVDFFVQSEESFRETKKFVKRDFFSVPVFSGSEHRFVWAIPKGSAPRTEDTAIRQQAAPILTYYSRLRAKYIGPNKPGVVALLRDWMDDGTGNCSPETALKKATQPQ